MSSKAGQEPAGLDPAVLSKLQKEFELGNSSAADVVNAEAIVRGGEATTTLESRWLCRPCPVCQHTFRPGDTVVIGEDGIVRHRTALLACAAGSEAFVPRDDHLKEFFAGLHDTWAPPRELPVIRLEPGHPLLAEAIHGFRRRECAVCGHTLRPFDSVVVCPCSRLQSDRARECRIAVHRDPVHGLNCWDEWRPVVSNAYCPTFFEKFQGA